MTGRIEALARARAEQAAARVGARIREAFPELDVAVEPERVVVRGHRLRRRMIGEPALRWLGGLLR